MPDSDVPQPDLRVSLTRSGPVRVLTLERPERHNSLTPELLEAARAAVAEVAAEVAASDHSDPSDFPVRALVLAGAGRSFSTGGDVAGFAARRGPELEAYARRTVGALNGLVLDLLGLDVPVIAAVHGPVTGGSLGLVLASDLVVVGPRAWFQPYYVEVGFSPDGGWTALLPGRVGMARALAWQLTNERIDASTALASGLASHGADDPMATALELADRVAGLRASAVRRTKRLLHGDLDVVAARLDAELESFVEQITTDEAATGMSAFLS